MLNKIKGKSIERHYYALEYTPAGELFDYISEAGVFDEKMARYYMKQLLDGVKFCHDNGIAHRDLKMENLMLDSQFRLKIIDFGLAKKFTSEDDDAAIDRAGTKGYQPPEMLLGKKCKGTDHDLFSTIVITFMMLTQSPPFEDANQ